jgi:hypothetical protein
MYGDIIIAMNEQSAEIRRRARFNEASHVVTRAGGMLAIAQQGLRDMTATDHGRVVSGFCCLVVFGYTSTNAMRNLKTYDRAAFDQWFEPWEALLATDPLLRYFRRLRDQLMHGITPEIGVVLNSIGANAPSPGTINLYGIEPPEIHLNEPIADTSVVGLCKLYLAHLERMFESFAPVGFAVADRILEPG